ncbi:protocadherin-18 [Mobula birostris]|uniref:protocadherin-18 n=1 Tax=Mobula birostris TaxID=1983395 RepID=UPI003B27CA34
MGQASLLLLCCLVTTARPRDVSAEGVASRPEEFAPLSVQWEQEAGEEGAGRCRLYPTAPGLPDDAETSPSPPATRELLLHIPEGLAEGAAVAVVEAPGPGVECRLEAGPGGGSFGLRRASGSRFTLVTRNVLDREQRAEYNLTLVTENGSWSGRPASLTIRLTDENDNPPVFHQSAYRALVIENEPSNRTILTVAASDRDSGANGRVTYSIVSPAVPWPLAVHPTTGAIHSVAPLDYERAQHLDLVVEARDGGHPPARATVPVRLDVGDLNDNSPMFTAPVERRLTVAGVGGGCANGEPPGGRGLLLPVTVVKAVDADSGRNGELVYELVAEEGDGSGVFQLDSGGELRVNVCGVSHLLEREWRATVRVHDRGTPSRSASTVLTISFVAAATSASLGRPVLTGIALGAVCGTILPVLLVWWAVCGRRRRRRDGGAYNCRRAETDYRQQPRRPERRIQKTDITLLQRSRIEPTERQPDVPCPVPNGEPDPRHRQLLRELVRLSRAGCPDGYLELAAGSPHVQQISQLLSLLHQGQFQARPNFRGNKYLKNYRAATPEADRGSLKDSGQGESEEGESDSDGGRTSPIDQLLEDGLTELLAGGSWTSPTGLTAGGSRADRLSLEDLCWTLPLTLPSSDYKENVFSPESMEAGGTVDGEKTVFSTFGKGGADHDSGAGSGSGSLLTEMGALFQQLLSQKAETYRQPGPDLLRRLSARWSVLCEGEMSSGRCRGSRLPGLPESPAQGAGSE